MSRMMSSSPVEPPRSLPVVAQLVRLFRAYADAALSDPALFGADAFNRLALQVHDAQRHSNPVLRRYWEDAGAGSPRRWEEVPPVPTTAFRDVAIVSGKAEAVFRTSGTTSGGARRGEHHVASMALYRAAARGPYRRNLFAGLKRVRVVSLAPRPRAAPDSSLSAMCGFIAEEPEVVGTTWAFDPERGVDAEVVRKVAAGASEPIVLLATAFALVQLLEALEARPIRLPPDSRVMETGGFKGRTAEVDRETLYARISRQLGVPDSHIVNEYGMTELLSQSYDHAAGTVAEEAAPPSQRVHRFPPWVRTRALDPTTLTPLPPGQPGLLAHFDLANTASVCHVLTEDLGKLVPGGGFQLLGRAGGAEPRGCSLTAEAFLRAVRGRS